MKVDPFAALLEKVKEQQHHSVADVAKWEFDKCVAPKLTRNGWPPRFLRRHSLSGPQTRVLDGLLGSLKGKGAVYCMFGPRGTGKTTIAAHIAIERTELRLTYYSTMPENRGGIAPPQGIPVYYRMSDLVSRLKSLYADFGSIDAERQSNFSERLCDESLLVIDEIHECDEMRVKDRVLTDIVDKRYARRRDTILISNQTVDDFRHTANDSVLSRLTEHGGIFLCDWRSFRTKRQEADGEGAGLAVANR